MLGQKILSQVESLLALNSCQDVTKQLNFRKLLVGYKLSIVPNLSSLGGVYNIFLSSQPVDYDDDFAYNLYSILSIHMFSAAMHTCLLCEPN